MSDPILDRLEEQIQWYDRKSVTNQKYFKRLKIATIVCAGLIPVLVAFGLKNAGVPAALGALIVAIEAIQQLNQYHSNWISYRSTCESLRHEKFLFLGGAGPYAAANNPRGLLAERIESMVSQEHAKWASMQEQTAKAKDAATG